MKPPSEILRVAWQFRQNPRICCFWKITVLSHPSEVGRISHCNFYFGRNIICNKTLTHQKHIYISKMIQPKTPFLTPTTSKNPKELRSFFFWIARWVLDFNSARTVQNWRENPSVKKTSLAMVLGTWFKRDIWKNHPIEKGNHLFLGSKF